MKQKITLLLFLISFICLNGNAQTQFWSDTFEDTGAPSSGTRTPSITEFSCGGNPANAYFKRADLTGIALQSGSYSSFQGSKFWAAEDVDQGPTCSGGSVSANQQVTWSGINISGKSGLSFSGLFAANSSFGSNWEGVSFGANQDFVAVEYRIDGGAWQKAVGFYASSSSQSTTLNLDTNGDLIGDGAALTYSFAEFSANLTGTGTTLDLRLNLFANGSATEEIAVDNFRLFEASCTAPTVPTITATSNVVCGEGSPSTLNISGNLNDATEWRVYTGSCGGSLIGTTNGTTFIVNPTGSGTTYYIRGEGGCVTPGTCATITINVNPALTASISSQTNVACNGGTNGAATVTPTGGTSPFNYSWSPSGITTATATGLSAGTYTVIVTDANNCSASTSVTITEPTTLALTPSSQTNIACNGGSNGAAAVNVATGGAGSYTYNWTPGNPTGDGTPSVTGLSAGTWTCTVTDANSCTTSVNFTITQPTALVASVGSQTNVSCNGGTNGSATVSVSGGTPSYTYSWSPSGGTAATATGLSAGIYTVTVTDANACTATQSFTITEPTALSLTPSSQTNIACNGGSNGAATVNVATGGTGGYTYNWTPGNPTGDGTTSVTGLSAGTWTCTVTDANSCTTSVNFTITQPTALVASVGSQTNVSCNGGANGSATVSVSGGTPSYTYSWSPSGGTAATATGLSAGIYTVTVTDANACTATQSFTITEPTALSLTPSSQTNIACNGGSNGAATVNVATGGAGGYTYNWTPGNPTGDGTTSVTGLSAGTWTCTVTDANSCTTSVNFTITQPTALVASVGSQTNVSCNGGANGSATVSVSGGTPSYTYSWSPSGGTAATATGLSAGIYTVTVTDANACTATQSFTITEPTALSLTPSSQTNIACNGGSNGAATVNVATGGAGGYTYNWTPGNPTGDGTTSVTGLSAGTWTCTVTDANSCTTSVNFTITQPTALVASVGSQTNVSCNGGANGSATVSVSGGTPSYTYSWSPSGGTAATATGLSAGIYTVTVTDANACTATQSFTITEPTALSLTPSSQTNIACNGGSNGAATVNVATGGAGGYTYNWTPGNPTGDGTTSVTGLSAGTWTCTVTDANSCTTSVNFTITQPTALVASVGSQTNVSCNGGANGSATVSVSGGTPSYTYSWSPSGGTAATATGLSAGIYTVTVTDANACTATQSFTITEPTVIDDTVTENSGVLTANQSGATYQWYSCPNTILTGETDQSYTPTVDGDYKVEITVGSCTVESNCTTVLDVKDFERSNSFSIYPNPAKQTLFIKTMEDKELVIVNQLGQTVKKLNVLSSIENAIDISNLSQGIYLILDINNSSKSQKLIINN